MGRGNPLSPERKAELFQLLRKRDGDDCTWCGEVIDFAIEDRHDPQAWSFDHRRPHAEGGTWDLSNLQLMHRACNAEEGKWEVLARRWRGLN